MIAFLEGRLMKREEDKIILLVNSIGYEIMVPPYILEKLETDEPISLYIYYHQTERQPKPVLIGFQTEEEKDFFQRFISVGDFGPIKALKALTLTPDEIARAVENNDTTTLMQLKGIGARTANKIIATLSGTLEKFMLAGDKENAQRDITADPADVQQALDVLTIQLGYKPAEARQMIDRTLKSHNHFSSPEEILERIYHKRG